jgi:hypothetical protein
MPVIASVVVAAHIVTAVVEAMAVEPGTEIAPAVVTVEVPATPEWPVKTSIVSIPWIISVGIRAVISRSVENRDGNRKAKSKANTGTRRRFGEERQSSDRKNEDNELLHNIIRETQGRYHEFKIL